jgi:single-stranded-DNA-specific exonuclease
MIKQADERLVSDHSEQLKISPLLARILILRGLIDTASARRHLTSSLRADLPSPFSMAGMEGAVERLARAVRDQERIGVWGDYDVDGTTGARSRSITCRTALMKVTV